MSRESSKKRSTAYRYKLEENEKVSWFVYNRGTMLAELEQRNQAVGSEYLGNEYLVGPFQSRQGEVLV